MGFNEVKIIYACFRDELLCFLDPVYYCDHLAWELGPGNFAFLRVAAGVLFVMVSVYFLLVSWVGSDK